LDFFPNKNNTIATMKVFAVALALVSALPLIQAGILIVPVVREMVVEARDGDCFFGVTTPQGCGYVYGFIPCLISNYTMLHGRGEILADREPLIGHFAVSSLMLRAYIDWAIGVIMQWPGQLLNLGATAPLGTGTLDLL
jgi:hypothetical protein